MNLDNPSTPRYNTAMTNPLNNPDDCHHDPYFNSPDEFDIAYEDSVSSDPDGDSDFDPDFYEDPYWGD